MTHDFACKTEGCSGRTNFSHRLERKTLKIGQWRRIAARAAVVVQGRAYLPGVAPAPAEAAGPTEDDDREAGCLCHGCGRRYLVDLLVPDELWDKIRPDPSRGAAAGLLCPRCIGARLESLGQPAAFTLARTP